MCLNKNIINYLTIFAIVSLFLLFENRCFLMFVSKYILFILYICQLYYLYDNLLKDYLKTTDKTKSCKNYKGDIFI